ncbi:ABC transporter permease, partial [Bacillus tequilensis]|nr:ABC transporter permease [Bacillus tequilensis]
MNMLLKHSVAEIYLVLMNIYFVLWSLIMPIAFFFFFTY